MIPKARQLWFSTDIGVQGFDYFLWHKNASVLIIAHDRDSMVKIFEDKIRFFWDNLPERLREQYQVRTDRANELSVSRDWKSWSTIRVALSGRWWTYQFLHISEFWKICAKYPDKAREIVTGAIEAVPKDWMIFIESTAEWDEWYFYDWVIEAEELQESWKELNELEYKLHFFPWRAEETYRIDDKGIMIPTELQKYFKVLKDEYDIELDREQQVWYYLKNKEKWHDMKREYPSVLKECFEASVEGSYYSRYLLESIKWQRITKVPHDTALPVYVWFDLWWPKGSDLFSLWFAQVFGKEIRLINYRQGNEDLKRIANTLLPQYDYNYDKLIIPWDWWVKQMWDHWKMRCEPLKEAGYEVEVLKQSAVSFWIDKVQKLFPLFWFDWERCDQGIKHLRNYKKKRNSSLGRHMEDPEHSIASHWADSMRYLCIFIDELLKDSNRVKEEKPSIVSDYSWLRQRKQSFTWLRHDEWIVWSPWRA